MTAGRKDRIKASPRARRAMARLGIEPRSLRGTGPDGRIVEADVHDVRQVANLPPASHRASSVAELTREPSKRRRAIARLTSASVASVPHFYLHCELDATALVELRQRLLPAVEGETGVRLSLTDLFVRAMALALRDCPWANVIWRNDMLVTVPAASVGLVVGATVGSALADLDLDLAAVRGPILAPGLGAQGATPADLRATFGAAYPLVLGTSSRDILSAGPQVRALREAALRTMEGLRGQ